MSGLLSAIVIFMIWKTPQLKSWNPNAAAEVVDNTALVCTTVCTGVGKWGELQGFSWGTLTNKQTNNNKESQWLLKASYVWSSMVTRWMGDCYVLGFVPAPRFLWSQILCKLYKTPLYETTNQGPPMCICIQKDHICTLKSMSYMSEFGGLWKHQNNPACTKISESS